MVKSRFKANKLMRDKMPSIMKTEGIHTSSSHLPESSMLQHMCMKLEEEVDELIHFCQDKSISKEEKHKMITDEMADVMQVMMSLAKEHDIRWEDVEKWRMHKLNEKGGFEKGVHMDWVEMPKDHPKAHNYHNNHRYPEIHAEHAHHAGHDHKDHEHHGEAHHHLDHEHFHDED